MSGNGKSRIINVDRGRAPPFAEALGRMLPQRRQNPVKVNVPGGKPSKPVPEKKEPPKKEPPQGQEEQDQGTETTLAKAGGPAEPQQQKPATEETPGQKEAPINITVLPTNLIITIANPMPMDMLPDL